MVARFPLHPAKFRYSQFLDATNFKILKSSDKYTVIDKLTDTIEVYFNCEINFRIYYYLGVENCFPHGLL